MAEKWYEVKKLIAKDDIGKRDIRVKACEIDWIVDRSSLYLELGTSERFCLGSWAEAQLCRKIGISVKYFRECPGKIQAKQIKQWIRDKNYQNRELLIRLSGRMIRAILSGYYDPFDNHKLLELWEKSKAVSKFYYYPILEDTFLHIRAFLKPYASKDEEAYNPWHGFLIRNSEVGRLALSVRPSTYRYISGARWIIHEEYRPMFYKRHIGINRSTLEKQFLKGVAKSLEESKDWKNAWRK